MRPQRIARPNAVWRTGRRDGAMTANTSYYSTLGVSVAADDVVIRAAFKALMLKYHPDTNRSPDATQRAAEINQAFAVLGDARKRAQYDDKLKEIRTARSEADSKRQSSRRPSDPPPAPTPPTPAPTNLAKAPNVQLGKVATSGTGLKRWVSIVVLGIVVGFIRLVFQDHHSVHVDRVSARAGAAVDNSSPYANLSLTVQSPTSELINSNDTAFAQLSMIDTPKPLKFRDIEKGVEKFAKQVATNGFVGVRVFSIKCHKMVVAAPTWPGADQCAAFDYAAASYNKGYLKQYDTSTDQYLIFAVKHQLDQYKILSASRSAIAMRLEKIQKTAEAGTMFAVRARLFQQTVSNRPQTASSQQTDFARP
jgi:hypothetical protein